MSAPVELEFSSKYDAAHARQYLEKHQDGLARRLSHARDLQLGRRALKDAGDPGLVLDLPCGAGRFWPMLAEKPNRAILAADNSLDMLKVATASQPTDVVARVTTMQTSAFAIDLPDNAVDSIFCMRLLHHVGDAADRAVLLREFRRVTRDSVILSLWVDGNYKAWKRTRLEKRREAAGEGPGYQNRFVHSRGQIEREFEQAGLRVDKHYDFLPGYAMWRVYLLRKG